MDNKKQFIKPDAEIIYFSKDYIYTDVIANSVMEGGNFDEDQIP